MKSIQAPTRDIFESVFDTCGQRFQVISTGSINDSGVGLDKLDQRTFSTPPSTDNQAPYLLAGGLDKLDRRIADSA